MNTVDRHLEKGNKYNTPQLIVVHAMGEFIIDPKPKHATDFLEGYGLSAHALVDHTGQVFICRHDDEGAYHARGFNTNSLGIEFLVKGEHNYGSFLEAIKTDYVTADQYQAGVECVRNWKQLHKIKKIARHSDLSPGRKVDPGSGFPWVEFMKDITEQDNG